MKMKDIRFKTRLLLGIGAIQAFVLVLGWISWNQTGRLWLSTDNLYNHPYQVGIAAREIRINALEIHRIMKDFGLDPKLSAADINTLSVRIDSLEKVVYEDFDIVRDRFLGPKEYIQSAYDYFVNWKKVRDDLIMTRISKGYDESERLFRNINLEYVSRLTAEIQKMTDFAIGKGAEFYSLAEKEKALLVKRLIFSVIVSFLASLLIAVFTIQSVTNPLRILKKAAENYKSGNYDSRSSYQSKNELGVLSETFNELASVVQAEISVNEKIAKASGILMKENELRPFCRKLIEMFMNYTNSQVVAVFKRDEATGHFVNFESSGLDYQKTRSFDSQRLEGLIGNVITTGQITRIRDINKDNILSVNAITADLIPAEIISIPVKNNGDIPLIVIISSTRPYTEDIIRFIEGIWYIISSRMIGAIAFQKLADMSLMLEKQNSELEEKSKELVIQTEELKEFNIELEMQKKQLDEANRLKSSFLSNMSHELRTPLNSVIALSGVLSRRLNGKIPENEYNYLGIIEKNGKNLLALINDILDISRIESGKEEVHYTKFFPGEIIKDITDSVLAIAVEKNITVSSVIGPGVPDMICDRKKCQHILQNIISNAVKFTEKGSVTVTASAEKDNLVVRIKDTGIGIKPEFMPYLFDEFRQEDDKTSRKFGGSGLGLSIARKYCDILNGKIDVNSVQGEGTEFIVTLPLKPLNFNSLRFEPEAGQRNASENKSTEGKPASFSGKTILIVEDSEPQIIQIRDILHGEGFELEIAHNGREALETLGRKLPDAMILDLQMPDVDGFEVLEKIKLLPGASGIPIIILSAKHISSSDLKQLNGNNIHQLVQKGNITRNDLIGYIKKIFNTEKDSVPSITKSKKHPLKEGRKTDGPILIIEDNPDNMMTFQALLEGWHDVVGAGSGEEGIDKALVEKPQLILLDISLPGMDGYAVLERLRGHKELNNIPVIALTARAMKGDREDLLGHGFDGYISKPVDHDSFRNTINDYLVFKRHN